MRTLSRASFLLLSLLLACGQDPTAPHPVIQETVLVCITDWQTGTSTCQHRVCDHDLITGRVDCLNKPVVP